MTRRCGNCLQPVWSVCKHRFGGHAGTLPAVQKAALALFQTFLPLQLSQLWPDLINTILRIVNPSLLDSPPVVDASPRSHRTDLSSFSMERVVDLLLQLYRCVWLSRHSRIRTHHEARREAASSRSGGCKLLVHQDHLQAVAISPYSWLDLMSCHIEHQHVHHALYLKLPCTNARHVLESCVFKRQ